MIKYIKSIVWVCAILMSLNVYAFSGGDGSEVNPYQVETIDDLKEISNNLNSYFIQTANINNSMSYSPTTPVIKNFEGVYDGNGYSISTSVGYYEDVDRYSVFYSNYGTIKNVSIIGSSYIAPLTTYNYGTIEYCENKAKIRGMDAIAGGLTRYNYGIIKNSRNLGDINASIYANKTGLKDSICGGIAAINYGIIEQCYTIANISVGVSFETSGSSTTYRGVGIGGGIAGINKGIIDSCYATTTTSTTSYGRGGEGHYGGITGGNGHYYEYSSSTGIRQVYSAGIVRNSYAYFTQTPPNTDTDISWIIKGIARMNVDIDSTLGNMYNNYTTHDITPKYKLTSTMDADGDPTYTIANNGTFDNKITDTWLQSQQAVDALNNPVYNQLNNPWFLGADGYPTLIAGPIKFNITADYTKIGDNTPIHATINSNLNAFAVRVTNNSLTNDYTINNGDTIKILKPRDPKFSLINSGQVITTKAVVIDYQDTLAQLLDLLKSQAGLNTVSILIDDNRYYESNPANQILINEIKGTNKGTYFLGNILSNSPLIDLLEP